MRVLVALIAFGAATVAAASGGPLAAPLSPASAAPISGVGATGLLRRGGGRASASASASASARSPPLQLRGGGKGPLAEFRDVVVGAKKHLCASAAARATSILAMYPVDTIKTRMQMGVPALAGGGGLALFKGAPSSLVGQVPYATVTFGSYEIYKEKLAARFPEMALGPRTFLAAVMGDLTGSLWLCPSEVIKQKLQGGVEKNFMSAIKSIAGTKGLGGFYQGYTGQIARDVPFRAVQLVSYELTKQAYIKVRNTMRSDTGKAGADSTSILAWEGAVVGAIAGSFSAALTNPLDVLKTRMMTGKAYDAKGAIQAVSRILANDGAATFLNGIVPRVVYIGPSCAIFFMVYESVKNLDF